MSDSLRRYGLQPARFLYPWDFPGKNTGASYHFLLQAIFPTQGSNLHLSQSPTLTSWFFTSNTTWEALGWYMSSYYWFPQWWWTTAEGYLCNRGAIETPPLLYSAGPRDLVLTFPGLLLDIHDLKAHYSSPYFGSSVLKNDVLAVGEGKHVHFLSRNHTELNIALPK